VRHCCELEFSPSSRLGFLRMKINDAVLMSSNFLSFPLNRCDLLNCSQTSTIIVVYATSR
jgi:hypothetical protein